MRYSRYYTHLIHPLSPSRHLILDHYTRMLNAGVHNNALIKCLVNVKYEWGFLCVQRHPTPESSNVQYAKHYRYALADLRPISMIFHPAVNSLSMSSSILVITAAYWHCSTRSSAPTITSPVFTFLKHKTS